MNTNDAVAVLREALIDMYNGWRYIRQSHGDLYGVGWDRAEFKARDALAATDSAATVAPLDNIISNAIYGYGAMLEDHHGVVNAIVRAIGAATVAKEGGYPETSMTDLDFNIIVHEAAPGLLPEMRAIANAALRHAIDAGEVVIPDAQFNGFDISKLPPILISCVAKLWPGSQGMFWERALERMPERIEHLLTAREPASIASVLSCKKFADLCDQFGLSSFAIEKLAAYIEARQLDATPKPEASAATQQAEYPYQEIFDSIGASVNIQGNAKAISVKAFVNALQNKGYRVAPISLVNQQAGEGTYKDGWNACIDAVRKAGDADLVHRFGSAPQDATVAAPISEGTGRTSLSHNNHVGEGLRTVEARAGGPDMPRRPAYVTPATPVSDGDAMPPLPEPEYIGSGGNLGYTESHLRAYGQACIAARTVTGSGGSIGEDLKFRRLAYQWQHELGDAKDFHVLVAYIDARTARNAGVAAPDTSARDAKGGA